MDPKVNKECDKKGGGGGRGENIRIEGISLNGVSLQSRNCKINQQ
jgi:hypothetical protein